MLPQSKPAHWENDKSQPLIYFGFAVRKVKTEDVIGVNAGTGLLPFHVTYLWFMLFILHGRPFLPCEILLDGSYFLNKILSAHPFNYF